MFGLVTRRSQASPASAPFVPARTPEERRRVLSEIAAAETAERDRLERRAGALTAARAREARAREELTAAAVERSALEAEQLMASHGHEHRLCHLRAELAEGAPAVRIGDQDWTLAELIRNVELLVEFADEGRDTPGGWVPGSQWPPPDARGDEYRSRRRAPRGRRPCGRGAPGGTGNGDAEPRAVRPLRRGADPAGAAPARPAPERRRGAGRADRRGPRRARRGVGGDQRGRVAEADVEPGRGSFHRAGHRGGESEALERRALAMIARARIWNRARA